jgi:hypothetical protein
MNVTSLWTVSHCGMFPVLHRARLRRTVGDGRDRPRFLRKAGEGHESGRCLGNTVNALIFYWVQGYMSAANIALLEGDSEYVDLMDERKLLPLIQDYCKKNPGKKPISVIDQLIDDTDKVEGKWKSGTIPWAADD